MDDLKALRRKEAALQEVSERSRTSNYTTMAGFAHHIGILHYRINPYSSKSVKREALIDIAATALAAIHRIDSD